MPERRRRGARTLDLRLTPEQEAWKQEVTAFLEREMTPAFIVEMEKEDASTSYASVPFSKKLAERGWLTLHWPREYGGQERSFIDQAILNEQMGYHWAPTGAHNFGTNQVGVALILYGTEEQKARFLPPIAKQEIVYSQGFTEPDAGSDLASLRMRAVKEGDHYVLEGQKTFIGSAHRADYIYLLARTDPEVPKRKGMSMFLADLETPGITVRGMRTINHGRVNEVFFESVKVPATNMVGEPGQGWTAAMTSLNLERSGVSGPASARRTLEELVRYAKETTRYGKLLSEDRLVRYRLARSAVEIEVQRMLSWRIAWMQSQGRIASYEASIQSLRRRQFEHKFANWAMQLLGLFGQLQRDSRWAPLRGSIERMYCTSSAQHAGGTTEIQKNIIAFRGLGMPR